MPAKKGNQYAKGNIGGGRKTEYKEEYANLAFKFCLLGATDVELGKLFEVSEKTINNWKIKYEEFNAALKRGKVEADSNIADRLYQRALGYEHPEDQIFNNKGVPLIVPTIKHYPPDPTAAIFWLKNRQAKKWRDIQHQRIAGEDGGPVEVKSTTIFDNLTKTPEGREIINQITDLQAKAEKLAKGEE